MLPSGGQVKIIQCVYLIVFLSVYVKILQPVAICTVFVNTGGHGVFFFFFFHGVFQP